MANRVRYLTGFTNISAEDRAKADAIAESDLVEKWENEDGSVVVNYLSTTPRVQGQCEWLGRRRKVA